MFLRHVSADCLLLFRLIYSNKSINLETGLPSNDEHWNYNFVLSLADFCAYLVLQIFTSYSLHHALRTDRRSTTTIRLHSTNFYLYFRAVRVCIHAFVYILYIFSRLLYLCEWVIVYCCWFTVWWLVQDVTGLPAEPVPEIPAHTSQDQPENRKKDKNRWRKTQAGS